MPVFKNRKFHLLWMIVVLIAALLPVSGVQAGGIGWHEDLRQSSQVAARQQKPMLVMVGADWCGYCHKMLNETFSNPQVASRINDRFVPVLLDADRQSAVVEQLNVKAFPTVLVISPSNKVLARFEGYQSASQLETLLASFQVRPSLPPSRTWAQALPHSSMHTSMHTSFLKAHSLSTR